MIHRKSIYISSLLLQLGRDSLPHLVFFRNEKEVLRNPRGGQEDLLGEVLFREGRAGFFELEVLNTPLYKLV